MSLSVDAGCPRKSERTMKRLSPSKGFSIKDTLRRIDRIAGAGSGGCVLDNRLSTDPATRVLVIEAGGEDRKPWIHIPAGFYRNIYHPHITWQFETEPVPGLGGRRVSWPRGKVLGGSSSINGLIYIRGQKQDSTIGASSAASAGAMTTCCPISAVP